MPELKWGNVSTELCKIISKKNQIHMNCFCLSKTEFVSKYKLREP